MIWRIGILASVALALAACGGGGSGGGSTAGTSVTATPAPSGGANGAGGDSPAASPQSCSLRARQDWAAAQLREWYLFPNLLAANVDPASYSTVDDYVDALTAPARAQGRDRYFTHLASIREEDAYYDNGTSEGFGFRLALEGNTLIVREAYEGAPALAAGMDRGTRITEIGTSEATARSVTAILASGGGTALSDALGTGAVGETRFFRFTRRESGIVRTATMTTASYTLQPVSPAYGVQIMDGYGMNGRVGYINLRTFVTTAEAPLRAAFARFRAEGIDRFIVDLRYNGGGLISTAELLGDLIGGSRTRNDVQSRTTFRPEKSAENSTRYFAPQPQSVATSRVAFLTTSATASASELVINAMTPYLHGESIIVGRDTYGKPVGQIAIDRAACDDRLRIVALATTNAAGRGDYYRGLAGSVEATCRADDMLSGGFDAGDAMVGSARLALALGGRACSPITPSTGSASGDAAPRSLPPEPLRPRHPNPAQRLIEGLF